MGALLPNTAIPALPSFIWAIIPIGFLINSLYATFILWGEEFGWRGYLQIRLFSENPLLAAVTTGIIWGIWHYPLNLRGYNFPEHPVLGLAVFPVSTVLLSIIFGWLRLRSGSVWPACLAHAATNAIGGSLTILLFLGGPDLLFTSYVGLLGWIPLGAFCLWIILTGQLKPEKVSGAPQQNMG
jgi:membrane protease YdiL (CAAX protease family)